MRNSGKITLIALRLHKPVKNPISDNSNILWNSPSLGINSRYRLTLIFKMPIVWIFCGVTFPSNQNLVYVTYRVIVVFVLVSSIYYTHM